MINKIQVIISLIFIFLLLMSCPTVKGGGQEKPPVINYTGCLLSINKIGSGSVSRSPDREYYTTGTNVTLKALPDPGYAFDRWEGDLNATINQANIFMNTNKTVNVLFVESTATYSLDINITGSGTVTKDIDQTEYLTGTTVKLTAIPSDGFVFDHWEGDVSGTSEETAINVSTNNKSVTAVFLALYNLDVEINSDGSGDIIISPLQNEYKEGTQVKISALPKPGYAFNSWSGDLTGSTNPVTITINSNKNITANFDVSSAMFALNTSITGPGSINRDPDHVEYLTGTTVKITANPDSGCMFDHWEGDLSGSENPVNVVKKILLRYLSVPEGIFPERL